MELAPCGVLADVLPADSWAQSHDASAGYDLVIVLRGLQAYTPSARTFNILWIISHPDMVSPQECNSYDMVCVASAVFAANLRGTIKPPVYTLNQATAFNRHVIDSTHNEAVNYPAFKDIVFIGNSRNVFRKSVKYAVENNLPVSVVGMGWAQFIDSNYIAGQYLPYQQLPAVYRKAKIILNDHWQDMSAWGFISNRVFDVIAAGGTIVTDRVEGMDEMFKGQLLTYDTEQEFLNAIECALNDPNVLTQQQQVLKSCVLKNHTFANRAKQLTVAINRECNVLTAENQCKS